MLRKKAKKHSGFTLIELLIVIAIIGILSGVVMVSTQGGVAKAKKASATASVASVLPELVTCNDDDGFAKSTVPSAGDFICCTSGACTAVLDGHSAKWPDLAKTGWDYSGAPTGTIADGDYKFTIKMVTDNTQVITCDMAANGCS